MLTATKTAAIGGEQESSFEKAFASLAYVYLRDKAPRLLDYVIGFQLVDRNDDNTKAFGVFGFKVGQQWLYAPVFYLSGDLKGHELLYVKAQDLFLPLKENWINYLTAHKPFVLGENSPGSAYRQGGMQPDFRRIATPPFGLKMAASDDTMTDEEMGAEHAAGKLGIPLLPRTKKPKPGWRYKQDPDIEVTPEGVRQRGAKWNEHSADKIATSINTHGVHEWLRPFLYVVGSLVTGGEAATKNAHLRQTLDLGTVLSECPELSVPLSRFVTSDPLLKKAFTEFYSMDKLIDGLTRVKAAMSTPTGLIDLSKKKSKPALMPGKRVKLIFDESESDDERDGRIKRAAIDLLRLNDVLTDKYAADDLSSAEKTELLDSGTVIRDRRDPAEITKAYDVRSPQHFVTPSASGVFEVLLEPGELEKCLIVHGPVGQVGPEPEVILVRLSDKRWDAIPPQKIFHKPSTEPRTEYAKYLDGLSGAKSMSKGGIYVLLDRDGNGTMPFTVEDKLGDGEFLISFRGCCWTNVRAWSTWEYTAPRYGRGEDPFFGRDGNPPSTQMLRIGVARGKVIKATGQAIYAPDDAVAIKLAGDEPYNHNFGPPSSKSPTEEAEDEGHLPMIPVSPLNERLLIYQKSAKLSVDRVHGTDGVVVGLGDSRRRFHKKGAAAAVLVRDIGLSVDTANELWKRAQAGEQVRVALKFASAEQEKQAMMAMDQMSPGAPAIPDPNYSSGGMGGLMQPQVQNSVSAEIPYQDVGAHLTDPSIYEPMRDFDPLAQQTAQNAANTGQKEVFDTTMIAGLLKNVRDNTLVDRYLGDLMKALDRLGRVYFLFLWHNDAFRERYGQSDLPELEDALRNAFESLGDLVLYLRERAIMPFIGELGAPDISDVARE